PLVLASLHSFPTRRSSDLDFRQARGYRFVGDDSFVVHYVADAFRKPNWIDRLFVLCFFYRRFLLARHGLMFALDHLSSLVQFVLRNRASIDFGSDDRIQNR